MSDSRDNSKKYKYSSACKKIRITLVDKVSLDGSNNTDTNKERNRTHPNSLCSLYEGNPMCDPNGSYTGKPADEYEVPVQDADDL